MGKTQSKPLDDDKKTGFNIVDVCLTTGGIIQFLYFVLFIYTIINMPKYHSPGEVEHGRMKMLTLFVFVVSIVTLALISCYKTVYKKNWEEKTNLINNILCETPGIKNRDLLNNNNLLLSLIVIQAFTALAMIFLVGQVTGKFCLDLSTKKSDKSKNNQDGGLLNSDEFLRTTE